MFFYVTSLVSSNITKCWLLFFICLSFYCLLKKFVIRFSFYNLTKKQNKKNYKIHFFITHISQDFPVSEVYHQSINQSIISFLVLTLLFCFVLFCFLFFFFTWLKPSISPCLRMKLLLIVYKWNKTKTKTIHRASCYILLTFNLFVYIKTFLSSGFWLLSYFFLWSYSLSSLKPHKQQSNYYCPT